MRACLVASVVGLAVSSVLIAQPPKDSVEQELIRLEQQIADASVKHDRATLERRYADDYMYTHSNGVVMDKAQELADLPNSSWTSVTLVDMKVRIIGDVGILTGLETFQGTATAYKPGPRRFTDIFVKRNGRWQQIAGQSTTSLPRSSVGRRDEMRVFLSAAAAATLFASSIVFTQGTDPVIGRWELNVAKSHVSPGPRPRA